VWTVTAVGGTHICIRRVDPARIFEALKREHGTMLCAAPTVLIGIANASEDLKGGVPREVRVLTAGAPPAASTIERLEGDLGWELTQVYGLTETSPFISVCEPRPEHESPAAHERAKIKARQGVELVTSGELRVVDEAGTEVPADGLTMGEIIVRGNVVMQGCYENPEATAQSIRGGWVIADSELRELVREHIAHFKCPTAFHFVLELPKTATGKIQKHALRQLRSVATKR